LAVAVNNLAAGSAYTNSVFCFNLIDIFVTFVNMSHPDQADIFPFGAYQDGFEKLLGDKQLDSAPMSNTPAQGAQVYEKIMACTPGLPPFPQSIQPPPQVMALCTELGRVTAEMNDLKRDVSGIYSNMGTLRGNLDILHDELGCEIKTFATRLRPSIERCTIFAV
jgi:hypothetical protein